MTQWTRVLRKVDEYRWEIPQDYKPGMRVPGLVYADEAMLRQIGQDQALEQVANVATLPGIVRYSLAMPDIHWGYGFPVGGVAALRADDGVISPGGVGYDINCLAGDTRVLHEFGYHRPIAELEACWPGQRVRCVNPHTEVRSAPVVGYLQRRRHQEEVYRLTTESGRELVATGDHPILTPDGMVVVRDLPEGGFVSTYPFEGVPYEEPSGEVVVDEADVARVYPGSPTGLRQVLRVLRDRGLVPLRMNHPKLPYLVKLLGLLEGDGTVQLQRRNAQLVVYGQPEDLQQVRQDILALGFRPSPVHRRRRRHRIQTAYGQRSFEHTESSVRSGSSALVTLLCALGATPGDKAARPQRLPAWLERGPRWMRRLYLAAFFGAELTAPRTVTGHPYNFYGPVLSLNKLEEVSEDGLAFLEGIRRWLREFGVEARLLASRPGHVRRDGRRTVRLRLQVSSTPENLVRLWTRVGFEYNRRRQFLANVASTYLALKERVVTEREEKAQQAQALYAAGVRFRSVLQATASLHVNSRFVERSIWEPRKSRPRIASSFPTFPEFLRERTRGLGQTGQVWERVVRKDRIPFDGWVYDLTVADPHHNFIANGLVVSNCGVRLLRTDLTEDDVRPRLRELVEELFRNVPSGVGSTGKVRVSLREVDDVLRGGARWAVERGFGTPADLDSIEASGQLRDADPDAVSPRAKERGKDQIGTLGSGNHFLEVQVVEEVYDRRAAEVMGLFPGQVVVFIHTGSRGLGYQVCEDYLRVADRALKKYGISLPDRQLACAPFSSPEGQEYFRAMCCAANFAWANRQMITHWVRESFTKVLGRPLREIGLQVVYDVAHNIAKLETYPVDGRPVRLVVHRKGATRAFPPGHPEIPARYRDIGQPVLIPGDMGRYSFVAVGTERAMEETFGSTCHGAGRVRSRKAAVRELRGVDIAAELEKRGILVRAQNRSLLAEEASEAYKDVADVVEVCHGAGISRKVAKMRPIGVVKG